MPPTGELIIWPKIQRLRSSKRMDFRDVSVPPINPLAAKNMFFLSKKWREFRKRQVWTLLVRLIVESFWCKKLPWRELVGFSFQGMSGGCLGCGPVPVTTRIITFLVGDPYKHSFATVTGRGPHPRDATFLFQSSTTFCRGNTLWTGGPFDIFFCFAPNGNILSFTCVCSCQKWMYYL